MRLHLSCLVHQCWLQLPAASPPPPDDLPRMPRAMGSNLCCSGSRCGPQRQSAFSPQFCVPSCWPSTVASCLSCSVGLHLPQLSTAHPPAQLGPGTRPDEVV